MIQKVIQVGNSLAITIPKEFAKKSNLKRGESVAVETDFNSRVMLMKPKSMAIKTSLTPEFYEWLKEINEKYKDMIIELARK